MVDDEKTQSYLNPNYAKEWEVSRGVLDRFDGYLNDLRKYGFTLITALLAASALLLPYSSQIDPSTGLETTSNFPDIIKFVVLLVNLLLILAVTVLDRNYTVFLKAAATRARVLERALNLELTEVITHRYRSAHSEWVITGLYSFFMVMVLTLGLFVLRQDWTLSIILLLIVVAAIGGAIAIRTYIKVDYPSGPIDYTLDRLQCTQRDQVAITLTNLGDEEVIIDPDTAVWAIRKQDGKSAKEPVDNEDPGKEGIFVKKEMATKPIVIECRGSYSWLWPVPDKFSPGIYEVWRPEATYKSIVSANQSEPGNKNKKTKVVKIIKDEQKPPRTILVPLGRSLRIFAKPSGSSHSDSKKKLEAIKKILN